jgi:RND family efflux transporter MFP subunit
MFPGDLAKPDMPVFTVMDLSTAVARAQMPEAQGGVLRKGQACGFTPADAHDAAFNGRISVINQAVDPQRRTIEVWCEIPNAQHGLKSGSFGALAVTTGTVSQSVVVPVSAVQFAEGEPKGTVMIVDDKRIAHTKEVETGEVVEGRVRILSGLKGGETVIIEGGYSLPDGTEVRVAKEEQ